MYFQKLNDEHYKVNRTNKINNILKLQNMLNPKTIYQPVHLMHIDDEGLNVILYKLRELYHSQYDLLLDSAKQAKKETGNPHVIINGIHR